MNLDLPDTAIYCTPPHVTDREGDLTVSYDNLSATYKPRHIQLCKALYTNIIHKYNL